jgi:hypothetical protein
MRYNTHERYKQQEKIIRRWLVFFIIALVMSGLTAVALETELGWLVRNWPAWNSGNLYNWVRKVYEAIRAANGQYPFLLYGCDWLAFAHLVIAVVFIGPLRDPVKNVWIIEAGMIACVGVFPLAFIAGPVRGIPVYWRLIDCSFGLIGLIPLIICYKKIRMIVADKAGRQRGKGSQL